MKNTPLKTEKNGKITANLYYDFIDEIYTIERKTKRTQWKEHTKDRQHASKLFYLFPYYNMKELEKKLIYKIQTTTKKVLIWQYCF